MGSDEQEYGEPNLKLVTDSPQEVSTDWIAAVTLGGFVVTALCGLAIVVSVTAQVVGSGACS